jgi:hypothetical protein
MSLRPSLAGDYRDLYRRAFQDFGTVALWNMARLSDPAPGHALAVARALRIHGDRDARQLAEDIEQAVRSGHHAADHNTPEPPCR